MGIKFSYHKLLLTRRSEYFGSAILKPIIPIKISWKERELRYAALIDSGADFCIFDAQVGEYLGLEARLGRREPFGGIQERGGAEAFLHDGFGILGQKGFFDIFIVKFDLLKEEIELKERR